jgi:DNA-binding CsgD family transcriptional regulator
VLQAVPAESETTLSFSGIGDLLDPVLDEALEPLPAAQRRALSLALVLEEEDDGPAPDSRAIGVALLGAIRGLAKGVPVVLAIDDVQWLDSASSGALAYAARRLRDEPVGTLLAKRSGTEARLAAELRRAGRDRFHEVQVGPLDPEDLNRVVQTHLDVTMARPLLVEVHDASGGNPFYALEIVRSLRRTGVRVEAGRRLPVPDALRELVDGRLSQLPADSRECLLVAAALSQPTVGLVEAATDVPIESGLAPAVEAGIVELDDGRIRFTHPLLAAGAYESVDAGRRAQVHRRLADLVEDPEARARHLAAAVFEPDADVADALEGAAATALARGAPRAAALLLERSAALTPGGSELAERQRILQAAAAHHEAGDADRARALLESELERAPAAMQRAEILVALARVTSYDEDLRGASALYEQALDGAEPGSPVEALAQEGLAGALFRLRERLVEAVELSEKAATTARAQGAVQLEAESLATKAITEAALGRAEAVESCNAALALQPLCGDRPLLRQPRFAVTVVRFWHDDLGGAQLAYEEMAALATERGDESSLPYIVVMLAQIDCALGRFDDAVARAEAGEALAVQAGQRTLHGYVLAVRAVAQAHLGSAEEATRSGTRAFELAGDTGAVPIFASWALGHLALSRGDPTGALENLGPLLEHHDREAIREPGALPFASDAIEALVATGRLDEAVHALDPYEAAAERLERRRGLAAARRCRGLLVAVEGDLARATRELEAAVELSSGGDTPFERARSLMALGAAQRRAKRRREARETLEEALAGFERVGAALWAERARGELKRISGRAATPGALTPAEERVATLVAEGKTNREVAAALYLSDRTVEGHLSHIFGKLGIKHRAEVGPALASRQTQGVEGSNTGDSPVSADSLAP